MRGSRAKAPVPPSQIWPKRQQAQAPVATAPVIMVSGIMQSFGQPHCLCQSTCQSLYVSCAEKATEAWHRKGGQNQNKPKLQLGTTNPNVRQRAPLTAHILMVISRLHCMIKPRTKPQNTHQHRKPAHKPDAAGTHSTDTDVSCKIRGTPFWGTAITRHRRKTTDSRGEEMGTRGEGRKWGWPREGFRGEGGGAGMVWAKGELRVPGGGELLPFTLAAPFPSF